MEVSAQILCVEYFLHKPLSEIDISVDFLQRDIQNPIPNNICIHVHNYYPYFLIPYPEDLSQSEEEIKKFILEFTIKVEEKMNAKRFSKVIQPFIYNISKLNGFPFYGYCSSEKLFLKIEVFHPTHVSSIAGVLQSGHIMDRNFHVYEAHVSYQLQFLIDNNLYGMSNIDLKNVKFRYQLPNNQKEGAFNTVNVPKDSILNPKILKISSCELEVDVDIKDPITSTNVDKKIVKSLFIIWEEEKERRRKDKLNSQPTPINFEQTTRTIPIRNEIENLMYEKLEDLAQQDLPEIHYTCPFISSQFEKEKHFIDNEDSEIIKMLDWMRNEEPELREMNQEQIIQTQKDINDILECSMLESKECPQEKDYPEPLDFFSQLDGFESKDDYKIGDFVYLRAPKNIKRPFIGMIKSRDDLYAEILWFLYPDEIESKISFEEREIIASDYSDKNKISTIIGKCKILNENEFQKRKNEENIHLCRYEIQKDMKVDLLSKEKRKLLWGEEILFQNVKEKEIDVPSEDDDLVIPPTQIETPPKSQSKIYESPDLLNPSEVMKLDFNDKSPQEKVKNSPKSQIILHTPELIIQKEDIVIQQEETIIQGNDSLDRPIIEENKSPDQPKLINYQKPFYSNVDDAIKAQKSKYDIKRIPKFQEIETTHIIIEEESDEFIYEYQKKPPSRQDLLKDYEIKKQSKNNNLKIGFQSEAKKERLSIISIEIQVLTREWKLPDPYFDSIQSIFYSFLKDSDTISGILHAGNPDPVLSHKNPKYFKDEEALIKGFSALVQLLDPDIISGWEIQKSSLGYIFERSFITYGINILDELSRTPLILRKVNMDEYGIKKQSGMSISGRVVLNIWRNLKDFKLRNYSIQNVVFHILNIRIPEFDHQTLTKMYNDNNSLTRHTLFKYYIIKTNLNLKVLEHIDFVHRTSILSQVYGTDFFSVVSRGSQFKVESVMLRISKPRNFFALSPSKYHVACQNKTECIPLVMEPMAGLYTSPVIVLDFQSLYPSIIIAYNLCFSTCLGKLSRNTSRMGALDQYEIPKGLLNELKDDILITPNGVMFVKNNVRAGILPRMLIEILETRIMVKKAMKRAKDEVLEKVLDARQGALKMIANVTYGYTAAGFTGRMPCVDLADSIVQLGRDSLERAIKSIESGPWNAKVVYGDTDSLFVLLEGRSREDAFKIGKEMASHITKSNPSPVTLQFEKVYQPLFLLTKKRYVGYSFENEKQKEPKFDAKGIETIRRDSCKLVSENLEKSLRILFDTMDVSKVKKYVQELFINIQLGKLPIRDYIFLKCVKIGTYKGVLPPAAIVASKEMQKDSRAEPLYKERVPYVVIYKDPKAKLMEMVIHPLKIKDERIHGLYYIMKQIIPAFDRIFGNIYVDVKSWFEELPKIKLSEKITKKTIDSFFLKRSCSICEKRTCQVGQFMCEKCKTKIQNSVFMIYSKISNTTKEKSILKSICQECIGSQHFEEKCISIECDIMFRKKHLEYEIENCEKIIEKLE